MGMSSCLHNRPGRRFQWSR